MAKFWPVTHLNILRNGFVELHQVLAPLSEGAREEVGENALDEREDQNMADRRERYDEDDRDGDQRQRVLSCAPQGAGFPGREGSHLRGIRA